MSIHEKMKARFTMKAKKFFYALFWVTALVCIGCSQHLLLNQREFADEASKLKTRSEVSVQDRNGQKHSGILIEPLRMLPDSSQLMSIQSEPDGKMHQFMISPLSSQTEVTQISIRRKVNAESVLTGMLAGTLAGGGIGLIIAYPGLTAENCDFCGVGAFFVTLGSSIGGFVAGTLAGVVFPGNRVLELKNDETAYKARPVDRH
ncbi:MAG: hypothetical protein ACRENG_14000 [bacterium]